MDIYFYWLIFLIPNQHTIIEIRSQLNEVLSIAAFFVSLGVILGHDLFKTKEISLEEFRKDHMRELNQMQSNFFKEYDPLRVQISKKETELERAQITIEYLKRLLSEEKARKVQSAEQVNQRWQEKASCFCSRRNHCLAQRRTDMSRSKNYKKIKSAGTRRAKSSKKKLCSLPVQSRKSIARWDLLSR